MKIYLLTALAFAVGLQVLEAATFSEKTQNESWFWWSFYFINDCFLFLFYRKFAIVFGEEPAEEDPAEPAEPATEPPATDAPPTETPVTEKPAAADKADEEGRDIPEPAKPEPTAATADAAPTDEERDAQAKELRTEAFDIFKQIILLTDDDEVQEDDVELLEPLFDELIEKLMEMFTNAANHVDETQSKKLRKFHICTERAAITRKYKKCLKRIYQLLGNPSEEDVLSGKV